VLYSSRKKRIIIIDSRTAARRTTPPFSGRGERPHCQALNYMIVLGVFGFARSTAAVD